MKVTTIYTLVSTAKYSSLHGTFSTVELAKAHWERICKNSEFEYEIHQNVVDEPLSLWNPNMQKIDLAPGAHPLGKITYLYIMQHIEGIPNGNYGFRTWDDGKNFYGLNTETKTVIGYINVMQSCGCCDSPEDYEWDWDDLTEDAQKLIREEIEEQLNKQSQELNLNFTI